MDIKIFPQKLKGTIKCVESKSLAHRLIIASALSCSNNLSGLRNRSMDIEATLKGVDAFGSENPIIDCHDSGTTFRFLLPIVMATHKSSQFVLGKQLMNRSSAPLISAMERNGCKFSKMENSILVEGKMEGGDFTLPGNISSQFISGLLFALPLTSKGGRIKLSTPLQSAPYVDMTLECLSDFGIKITKSTDGILTSFHIEGNQKYFFDKKTPIDIEGDWSNGSFWLTANHLGSNINLDGLDPTSIQGDRAIVSLLADISSADNLCIDATDIPDLVPILCVAAAFRKEKSTEIKNIERLKLKESNRIKASIEMINNLGGNATFENDRLIIHGKESLRGGTVDSRFDHRIAMSASIAATRTLTPVIIKNADSVKKSYPNFFADYAELGGEIVKF